MTPRITRPLDDAAATLDRVARRGSYGDSPEELEATIQALNLCADFFQVAASLPDEPIEAAKSELELSIQAGLTGTRSDRIAREYLTQYWIGTLLTLARIEPRILSNDVRTKRPDYLVDLGGFDCAVEIKRPESFNSSRDAMDRAAGQLRSFGKPGVICVDLTDCICTKGFSTGFLDSDVHIADRVTPVFRRHSEWLSDRAVKYNQSDKYQRVMLVVLFARIAGWRGLVEPQPEARYLLHLSVYHNACQGLVTDYAEHFSRIVRTGFERISGSQARAL
jgi:hypothetical protein